MSKGKRWIAVAGCCALFAVLTGPEAGAFFPSGGFNQFGQLRYAVWPANDFDTNNNGVIEPGEGLEIRLEGGPRGFTAEEIVRVKAGFQVWQDVPTSYASFRYVGPIEDPILPGSATPDYLPTVFMQVATVPDGSGNILPDDVAYILPEVEALSGLTLKLYAITDVPITSGGSVVTVPAGNILDCDIIVNASAHRADGGASSLGVLDLADTMVTLVGYMLGLNPTPLNNLEPFDFDNVTGYPIESQVIQVTGPDGVPRMIGATPSMFPYSFLTEDISGTLTFGSKDLAPDDISGVSWLYPRKDGQNKFFTISQEARTHTRRGTGIPSSPVSGAHVVAWANVENNESAPRIPLFSTMSGLFNLHTNTNLVGKFHMPGLWKQIEIPSGPGGFFEPSYVFTMNPLTGGGLERQAPPGFTSSDFDSLQGAFPISYTTSVRVGTEFSTNYPSEVFNEFGNVYGIENNAVGTPMVWDFSKNTLVSAVTGKTLSRILPLNRPMFGDPNDVCPMNVLDGIGGTGGTGIDTGNITTLTGFTKRMRDFRDNVLLRSAAGTALVDLYYTVSPPLARLLLRSQTALDLFRRFAAAMEWTIMHWTMSAAVFCVLAGLFTARLLRGRRRAAAALFIAVALLLGLGAGAQSIPMGTDEFVANSTHIFTGTVLSTECRWSPPTSTPPSTRIFTDVVVRVGQVVKGDLSAGSNVSFSVIGGQMGGFVLSASGIPTFTAGEEVVLYMVERAGRGLVLYGGERGKQLVSTNAKTGEKVVQKTGLAVMDAGKAVPEEEAPPPGELGLKEYLAFLLDMVRQQERAAATAR